MSWHLEFSPSDVLEMKKFLKIMSPMERLFRQLNSEKDSTLHICYPIVKVGHRSHILSFLSYLTIKLLKILPVWFYDIVKWWRLGSASLPGAPCQGSLKLWAFVCYGAGEESSPSVRVSPQPWWVSVPSSVLACDLPLPSALSSSYQRWSRGSKEVS